MTQQSFPDYLPKNKKNTCPQKGLYAIVNCILFCDSLIHNGTKLGRTQRYWLIYWWTDKQIEAYTYNGILISGKGKPTMNPHNMDRSQKLSFCYEKEARHKGLHAVSYSPLIWNSIKGKTRVTEGRAVLASSCTWGRWLVAKDHRGMLWGNRNVPDHSCWGGHTTVYSCHPSHYTLKRGEFKIYKLDLNKSDLKLWKNFPKREWKKISWKACSMTFLLLQSNTAELVP